MSDPWPDKSMVRPSELAHESDIGLRTIYSLLSLGDIPFERIGRSIRVPKAVALRFLGIKVES